MSVNEYFEKQSVAGLLVIKNGKIVYERYGLGNTEDYADPESDINSTGLWSRGIVCVDGCIEGLIFISWII